VKAADDWRGAETERSGPAWERWCVLSDWMQITAVGVCCCHTVCWKTAMSRAAPAVLSVRVSPDERALLEAAAEQARTNLSDFIRRRALEAAEADLLERRIVTIPAKHWAKFEAWAISPAKDVPALRKLAKTRPLWRK
jgi:uncharacterized protein (DUF1778 family)